MVNRQNPDLLDVKASSIKSVFPADGDICSATLHIPESASTRPVPAILMVGVAAVQPRDSALPIRTCR